MGRRAKQTLTQRMVDTAQATGRQYTLGDAATPGLRLWVGIKGEKRWQIRHPDGRRTILDASKVTLEQARVRATSPEPEPVVTAGPKIPTCKALIEFYAKRKGKAWCERTNRLHGIRVFLKPKLDRPIQHVTREWIEQRQDELLTTVHAKAGRTYKGSSVVTYRKAVAILFNWLIEEGMIAKSPFRKLRRVPVNKSIHVLSERNMSRLKDFLRTYDRNDAVACGLMLELCGGLRKTEVKLLQRTDFDWEEGRVDIRAETTKSKKGRWFHMTRELREFLQQRLPNLPNDYPFRTVSLEHEWNWIRSHAKLDQHITQHGLRHTFATGTVRRRGNLKSLQAQLGHADIATTMVYLHRLGEDSKQLAALWDQPLVAVA